MSKSIRFIGVAILCWAGVRAVSLGLIPGMSAFAFDVESSGRKPRRLPPIQLGLLPPIEPILAAPVAPEHSMTYGPAGGFAPYAIPVFQPYPVYVQMAAGAPQRSAAPQIIYINPPQAGPHEVHFYGTAPTAPMTQQLAAAAPVPAHQTVPSFTSSNAPAKRDRLSLSSWALMRNKAGPDSLANSGTLGGSEAGARLMWRFDPRLAATLRTSAPINSQRGLEAAVGLRYSPFASWPIAVTLERRHGFQDYGRNAFALFAEGGTYGRPLPWRSTLDGYFQAGVVDFNNPDWFVDGQFAVSRPVWRNLSAGFGAWAGAQPGLSRLDVGPRLSIDFGKGTRAHVDYRLNVAGNAQPGSGATITLAGDF
jgi:hypothetical protein